MNPQRLVPEALSAILVAGAPEADAVLDWPAKSWLALQQHGVLRWSIPEAHGGDGLAAPDLLLGYESLAGACLTTVFLLSQREAAVRRLIDGENASLGRELLPRLSRGEVFATVGLSQLTTSRQHGSAALTAHREGTKWVLNGVMPWVTGAARADYLLAGAVVDGGGRILLVVPRTLEGLSVTPAFDLMALRGSLTAEVRCENVRVETDWVLAGPAEQVLAGARGGTGGLETSCLALGLAGAAIEYLREESAKRPDLAAGWKRLEATRQELRANLHALVEAGATPQATAALRSRANRLVLGATQAALTAAKGTGFLCNHAAQMWARQALFFLVWSCPRPAADATIAHLMQIATCDDD
jgi:alkylation response protein AidB-like acyl-CoA dehydrogenase